MYITYPDDTVQNTYELIAWNKNEKSWLLAHLLGTTLKNEQLLNDDWLVNLSNEPLQGLLTCLSFLCTELLRLKYWKHPHCRHFHGPMPWSAKRKGKRGKKKFVKTEECFRKLPDPPCCLSSSPAAGSRAGTVLP